MRLTKIKALIVLSFLGLLQCQKSVNDTKSNNESDTKVSDQVIYGGDGRHDIFEILDERYLSRARSTVALVEATDLTFSGNKWHLRGSNFRQQNNLCLAEPFGDQDTAVFCSGSLVAQDTILTAGHCIKNQQDCDKTRFVFGFIVAQPNVTNQDFYPDDVYECSEIVHTQALANGADFAVVKLSRPVVSRVPLIRRSTSTVRENDGVYVIGHPVGLPMKITTGGVVRKVNPEYFVANLDTYGGNSGSPVFSEQTGDLEGVLVRGENDFVYQGNCQVSNHCTDSGCRGEDVTRIDQVARYLAASPPPLPPAPSPSPSPVPHPPVPSEITQWVSSPNLAIPDNTSRGITSTINVSRSAPGKKVVVRIEINHTYKGDLVVSVTNPEKKSQVLHNRTGGSTNNIVGSYDVTTLGATAGTWTLTVKDLAYADVGKLVKWQINFEN